VGGVASFAVTSTGTVNFRDFLVAQGLTDSDMLNFRTFLTSQGLSEADIEEVVREAREATAMVSSGAGMIQQIMLRALDKVANEKARKVLMVAAGVAGKVQEGSAELLKKR